MIFALCPHPDTPPPSPLILTASLDQHAGKALSVRFRIDGNIADIALPPVGAPMRSDGLWQTTCFEMFLGSAEGEAYREFNFSPSSAWAAYDFTGYRSGRSDLVLESAPRIHLTAAPSLLTLDARLERPGLHVGHRLGLSAVIDHGTIGKSYWAMAHPPGPPDFHHRDCFAGQVGAAGDA